MKTTIEIKNIYGSILFSYEKENNTVKDTVLEAIENNANLSYADLSYADLSYANLRSANLSYADLSYANLRYANLRSANLRSADLRYANLSYGDLSYADLSYANLRYADLRYADLRYAYYNPFFIATGIKYIAISDELTLELMRQDMLICGEKKMTAWANGGECPFKNLKMQRAFQFDEKKSLWIPGKPTMNIMEIWQQACKEMNIKIDEI